MTAIRITHAERALAERHADEIPEKEAGIRDGRVALELDVLSDNPAVQFYRSQGLELLAETRAPKPQEYGVPPELRMGTPLAD
jgi:hypothetical protein